MTAVNILRQSDSVHIISDGAAWDDDGVFIFAAPKAFALPHLNCAIAVRGAAIGLPFLAESLAMVPSYRHLKEGIADQLRGGIDAVRKMTSQASFGDALEIYVAGWHEDGPDAFTIHTSHVSGLTPWRVVPLLDLAMAPGELPIHAMCRPFLTGKVADDIDPRVDGLRILEAQRRHKARLPNGDRMFAVGGFAQLTSVYRDSVSTEILHRWPDVVGEPIDPEGAA
jgi:hypothetical protein